MKAVVYHEYGPPEALKLVEVERPVPKDHEVLVKIQAASVNSYDWRMLTADPFLVRLNMGLLKPKNKMLGADLAGRVEAVGKNVRRFKPGDEVFGDVSTRNGAFAEYAAAPETVLALKPPRFSFEQMAAVPMAAVTALQSLRDGGRLKAGQQALISGAGGGVGTFAVQIAKAFGAEVTAVCSAGKADMMKTLGADHVIDYAREDFTKSGRRYDLILGVNGYYPLPACKRALKPQGVYVMAGGSTRQILEALLFGALLSEAGGRQLRAFSAQPSAKDLAALCELLESGKVTPVIDRCYPLTELPEAVRYVGQGRARGKVVITVANGQGGG